MKIEFEEASHIYHLIQEQVQKIPLNEYLLSSDESSQIRSQKVKDIIEAQLRDISAKTRQRVLQEFYSWGPLCSVMEDESITEIIVNGPRSIWLERHGVLHALNDRFFSDLSFRNCLDRLSHAAAAHLSVEHPCADGHFENFRLTLVGSEITGSHVHISLRRHPHNPWTFARLFQQGWCTEAEQKIFQAIIENRQNFIVIGTTGSGKTSVLNSCLNELPTNERVVVIEDTSEIALPNSVSMKLLTREDPQGVLPLIDQMQLVKRSLRLRPDRLVMGEIRGGEAKDFLMALATGHSGSFGTLHAHSAPQALIRLEMLIQMGAPQWSLTAIRRLIQLSLNCILVTARESDGTRRFQGAYQLCSVEDNGILLEPMS
ncbi:MAG: ATPase, T2SS/T4P/T4SS family [Bdellovibrio sp.]